jgi:F-type H+-transporting ATPase subunit b
MQIDWWTLALQAVNFLVLVWLLGRFLYRPVRDVIEKRRALSEEAFAEAAAKEAEVDELKKRMEQDRAAMAQERQDMLKKLHENAAAEREKLLDQSRKEAETLIDDAREAVASERQAASSAIRVEAGHLAVELASKLLSQIDTNALGDAYLEKLVAQFEGMSADELEELRKDLEPPDARLIVVTTVAVPESAQARWRDRLATHVAHEDRIDFVTDPAIVGGAELRFPHTTMSFTWAEQLRKARRVLEGDETTK